MCSHSVATQNVESMSSFLYSPAIPEASWRQPGVGSESQRQSRTSNRSFNLNYPNARPKNRTRGAPEHRVRSNAPRAGRALRGDHVHVDRREHEYESAIDNGNYEYSPVRDRPAPRARPAEDPWAQSSQTMTERQSKQRPVPGGWPPKSVWPPKRSPSPPPPPVFQKGSSASHSIDILYKYFYEL